MTCPKCKLPRISEYAVKQWGEGYCPNCGYDLYKHLEEAENAEKANSKNIVKKA